MENERLTAESILATVSSVYPTEGVHGILTLTFKGGDIL
jgi:hypothetical protein